MSLVGVLCVYLLGAFVEVNFDISQWTKDARFIVALFMPIGAMAGLTSAFALNTERI
jgi:uncharacterized membrane protein